MSALFNARTMSSGTIFGFLFALVAIGLVSADSATVIKGISAKASTSPNDYFGDVSVEWTDTKKSSQLTVKLPTKKQLPDTMLFKITAVLPGQDPMEFESTVCEGLQDEGIGKSMVEAGLPKGEFPKECPFVAGDFVISKWNPPADMVPPGTTGPISGQALLMEEGKDPYVTVDYEIEVTQGVPGMGR